MHPSPVHILPVDASQLRSDPCNEFADVEGFGHVVIRTGVEALDDFGLIAKRGKHDDRHVREVADPCAYVIAVHMRHEDVENDGIRAGFEEHRNRRST